MDNKIIQDANDKITAISIMRNEIMDSVYTCIASKQLKKEVEKNIVEITKSEIGFLTKKARKECRIIVKEANAILTQIKNFDNIFVDNRSRIWGNRSDGR